MNISLFGSFAGSSKISPFNKTTKILHGHIMTHKHLDIQTIQATSFVGERIRQMGGKELQEVERKSMHAN